MPRYPERSIVVPAPGPGKPYVGHRLPRHVGHTARAGGPVLPCPAGP
ncbi:hypothetical protein [Streptomyces sp. NPDC048357]